nr:MAG TPA: dsDNA helicase [Caudoviricetes sp.]
MPLTSRWTTVLWKPVRWSAISSIYATCSSSAARSSGRRPSASFGTAAGSNSCRNTPRENGGRKWSLENKENAGTTLLFEDSLPDWYDGKRINEVLFCQQFLDKHPMKCVRGRLFTVDGLIEDEGQIGNQILEEISGCLTSGLSKIVANLLASIKLQAYSPPLPIETDRIHVANGTYFMDGSFTADKSYCNNRLTVSYDPDAPAPKRWLQFLSELLVPEDIPTLQEFLGYCLLPTTKGQKMLLMIGKGGEGKSRIGLVMRSLLGDSMNTTSIQKVESNRFSRADLENKLLMVDDDMDMSALPKTNYIKSIVTSECKMDMERKGVQSYQSQLYVRFLCFGNGALTALHDKSDGFFRRQIVLTTKDRPAGRADDPFLVDKLLREKESIFLWCLEGLHRLIGNNYQFSISCKARENMETVKRSSNNVIEFLQSEGYIRFRADSEASSKAIYEAYTRWCDDNAQKPMSANRVSSELMQNERLYNVEATNNVHVGGKRVRGFVGVEVLKLLP